MPTIARFSVAALLFDVVRPATAIVILVLIAVILIAGVLQLRAILTG